MVQQLLQISTTPIRFEMEIQWAKLEPELDIQPRANVRSEPAKVNVNTENAAIQIDTYEARRSLGLNNGFDFNLMYKNKAKEKIGKTTRGYVNIGDAVARIDQGVTIAQVYQQRLMESKQPILVPAFIPSAPPEMSWIPHQVDFSHQEGILDYEWQEMRNVLNYVPGSVRISIMQYPSVEIEYIGKPLYIPPSADPDYVEE